MRSIKAVSACTHFERHAQAGSLQALQQRADGHVHQAPASAGLQGGGCEAALRRRGHRRLVLQVIEVVREGHRGRFHRQARDTRHAQDAQLQIWSACFDLRVSEAPLCPRLRHAAYVGAPDDMWTWVLPFGIQAVLILLVLYAARPARLSSLLSGA